MSDLIAKHGETTPIRLDLAIADPATYGAFDGTNAPAAPVYGDVEIILTPLEAEYTLPEGETEMDISFSGTVYPTGLSLEYEVTGSATAAWADVTVSGRGGIISGTFTEAADTGLKITIRRKDTEDTVFESDTFDVVAAA